MERTREQKTEKVYRNCKFQDSSSYLCAVFSSILYAKILIMLFTGKGDNGTTKTYGAKERISKSAPAAEALGSLDEINSFLGLCKVASEKAGLMLHDKKISAIIHGVQQNLFIIQAEVAGFPKNLPEGKVKEVEEIINAIEKELPPITTFFISGGTGLAATYDIARTIARRAERRVVAVKESGDRVVSPETLAFLNRLSSLLYACARFSNHVAGIKEEPPSYA